MTSKQTHVSFLSKSDNFQRKDSRAIEMVCLRIWLN